MCENILKYVDFDLNLPIVIENKQNTSYPSKTIKIYKINQHSLKNYYQLIKCIYSTIYDNPS